MDPIHPIIPQPPNIPPVAPSPMSGKIDRERQRDEKPGGKRRPRPDATVSIHGETPADGASWEDYDAGSFDEDADGGVHVDVSA